MFIKRRVTAVGSTGCQRQFWNIRWNIRCHCKDQTDQAKLKRRAYAPTSPIWGQGQGWKLQNISAFPLPWETGPKNLPVRQYFCLSWMCKLTGSNFQNFSLSFGDKIFTCPALFLPVPDRQTACNFHPCGVEVLTARTQEGPFKWKKCNSFCRGSASGPLYWSFEPVALGALQQPCFVANFSSGQNHPWMGLRILAMYEAKNNKICEFWTFWAVIQLINHLFNSRQKAFLPNAL